MALKQKETSVLRFDALDGLEVQALQYHIL